MAPREALRSAGDLRASLTTPVRPHEVRRGLRVVGDGVPGVVEEVARRAANEDQGANGHGDDEREQERILDEARSTLVGPAPLEPRHDSAAQHGDLAQQRTSLLCGAARVIQACTTKADETVSSLSIGHAACEVDRPFGSGSCRERRRCARSSRSSDRGAPGTDLVRGRVSSSVDVARPLATRPGEHPLGGPAASIEQAVGPVALVAKR